MPNIPNGRETWLQPLERSDGSSHGGSRFTAAFSEATFGESVLNRLHQARPDTWAPHGLTRGHHTSRAGWPSSTLVRSTCATSREPSRCCAACIWVRDGIRGPRRRARGGRSECHVAAALATAAGTPRRAAAWRQGGGGSERRIACRHLSGCGAHGRQRPW